MCTQTYRYFIDMNYISDDDTCCSAGSISNDDDEVYEIKKAWVSTHSLYALILVC